MRKIFDVLLALGAAVLFALPVCAAAEPSQLVMSVAAQVIDIAKTKTGVSRDAAFREGLRNTFDLPYMGRLVLGTHWNEASEQQRARFLTAFETEEERAYSEWLGKLAGYTLIIDKGGPAARQRVDRRQLPQPG
jgi:phospholipid transport system substrate-binding protein